MRKRLNNIQIAGISFQIIAYVIMEILKIIDKKIPILIILLSVIGMLVLFIGNFLPKKLVHDREKFILTVRKKMYINLAASIVIFIFYIILNIKDDVTKRSVGIWFVGCVVFSSIILHTVLSISSKDTISEMSFMNIKRTDSIIMKILCCFMIILMVIISFGKLTLTQLGYLIGICFVLINILRVCIFTITENE
jgi:hypothetical protein